MHFLIFHSNFMSIYHDRYRPENSQSNSRKTIVEKTCYGNLENLLFNFNSIMYFVTMPVRCVKGRAASL